MNEQVDARAIRELAATDETRLYENVAKIHKLFDHVYNCPATRVANDWRKEILESTVPESVILDCGCYYGVEIPYYATLNPKKIWGIDISEKAIDWCKENYGDLASFLQCDAHRMIEFPDACFDLVVGNAILHHLEFRVAINEVHRILKPGGAALFLEPLRDNPASKIYRTLTPFARSRDETPLSRSQIKWADSHFSHSDHYFFSLISTPIAMVTSLVPGLEANNYLLRLSARLDNRIRHGPLKYWMRACYLFWIK